MSIGNRIKERRKYLDLSVDEVATKLNKNRATIYRYESSEIENLPITILEPLAEVLQTTPAWLMGYDSTNNATTPQDFSIINYNILQYIQHLGYEIIGDMSEGYLALDTKDSEYEITLSDLKDLETTTKSFIKFKISEIINKSRKFNKDTRVIELPKKEKYIWEEEGKEHLMPIAAHADGLSDEEKENMDNIIAKFLKDRDK